MDHTIQRGKTIILKSSKKVLQLPVEEILYVECDSYVLFYHLINQKSPEISTDSLKKIEGQLKDYNFLRINRNQLINMKYFRSYEIKDKKIKLVNGKILDVSRRKLSNLKRCI